MSLNVGLGRRTAGPSCLTRCLKNSQFPDCSYCCAIESAKNSRSACSLVLTYLSNPLSRVHWVMEYMLTINTLQQHRIIRKSLVWIFTRHAFVLLWTRLYETSFSFSLFKGAESISSLFLTQLRHIACPLGFYHALEP